MRKAASSIDFHRHQSSPAAVQAQWLPATDAPDVCVLAGSSRCRAAGQQVSAAALRIALACAGVEELRNVVEHQRSADQAHPALGSKSATDHLQNESFDGREGQQQSHSHHQQRQSGEQPRRYSLEGYDSNPVRSAISRSFPRSSGSGPAAAAAAQRSCDADCTAVLQQPQRRRSSEDSSGTSRGSGSRGLTSGQAHHTTLHGLTSGARMECGSTSSGLSSMSSDTGPLPPSFWPPSSGRGRSRSQWSADRSVESGAANSTSPLSMRDSSTPSSRSSMEGHRDVQRRESSEYLRPRSSMDGHAPPRRSMSLNMDALHHEDMARAVSTPHTNSRSPSHTTDRSVDSASSAFQMSSLDVCGDSGAWENLTRQHLSKRSESSPVPSARPSLTDSFARATPTTRQHSVGATDAPGVAILKRQGGGSGEGKWASLSDNQASVELFYRLRNCRQTVDFARRQRAAFARLDKALLTIPQAMEVLGTLREYEEALLGGGGAAARANSLSLVAHAQQTAEACRLAHPHAEWLQLAGLLQPLGKLLAHPRFGSEAQWSVCGETFPVGCAYSPDITAAEAFCNNPDRRRRIYTTPCGMYTPGCGLRNVVMSWGAPEYLHLVCTHNEGVQLPPPTLWLLRFAKFRSLATGSYMHLLDDFDRSMLPWLRIFQELSEFRQMALPGRMEGPQLAAHHQQLLAKHLPSGPLRW